MAVPMIGTELGHNACDHEVEVTECGYASCYTRRVMKEQGRRGEEEAL